MTKRRSKKTTTTSKAPKRTKATAPKAKKETAAASTGSLRQREPSALSNPFAAMRRLSDEMEQLFQTGGVGSLRLPRLWAGREAAELWGPDVDIFERKGQLVVRADLPGMTERDVTVEITGSELTIEGERRSEKEEKKEGYFRSERSYGSFRRSLPLPEGADTDNAEARFKDGVLEITMPTATKPSKGRRVAFKK